MRKLTAILVIAGFAVISASLPISPGHSFAASHDPVTPGPFSVSRDEYVLDDILITGPPRFGGPPLTALVEVVGSVHAPADLSSGPFPVAILLHGRHATCTSVSPSDETGPLSHEALAWPCPPSHPFPIWSYKGYDYIAEILASHGYVVISVSANGINAVDNSWADFGMDERGQLVMHHLDNWKEFNTTGGPPPIGTRFVGKLDMTNIGLMGHSRGGEGIAFTYLRNLDRPEGDRYGINALAPLAPVDFQRQLITNVPMSILLPYCDGDVSDLQGVHFYDDTRYLLEPDSDEKSYLLVLGANHNFYNTIWTNDDRTGSDPFCTRTVSQGGGRLTAEEQRTTGIAYVVGFMRTHVGLEPEFQSLFTGDEPPPPSIAGFDIFHGYHAPTLTRLDVNRHTPMNGVLPVPIPILDHDADTITPNAPPGLLFNSLGGYYGQIGLTPFSECELCGLTQPHERVNQLTLGWNSWATYANQIPQPFGDITDYDFISFRAVVNYGDSRNPAGVDQDFSVVLVDRSGQSAFVKVSDFERLYYPPGDLSVRKAVLQTIRIPLHEFSGVDLTQIKTLRFDLNRQAQGALLINDVAFAEGVPVGP